MVMTVEKLIKKLQKLKPKQELSLAFGCSFEGTLEYGLMVDHNLNCLIFTQISSVESVEYVLKYYRELKLQQSHSE